MFSLFAEPHGKPDVYKRQVVNFAKNTGLVTADPFGSYRVRFERTDRDYLTMEEITTLILGSIYMIKICYKRLYPVPVESVRLFR